MRFFTNNHQNYCGIDLHARSMYLCIQNQEGQVVLHRNMEAKPEQFLKAIKPFQEDVVVGVECIFTWYWLADLCAEHKIPFILGHALYMKAIHGGKAKNDRIDSRKIAALMRGGTFPMAYVYPARMRATRDLLRRRNHLTSNDSLQLHDFLSLHQISNINPNPFNPSTKITFEINRLQNVEVIIVDLAGKLVCKLGSGAYPPGRHNLEWNGADQFGNSVSSGNYFVLLKTEDNVDTRKMMLLR